MQIHEHHRPINLDTLQQRLTGLGDIRANGLLLRFQPHGSGLDKPPVLHIFADGRALIQGTTDPGIARSLYARYVGS